MPGSVLEVSTPGGGHHEAEVVPRDGRRTAPGDHPVGLGRDGVLLGAAHDAPLGLAHHLAGHDEDVAVLQVGGRRRRSSGEVVAGVHLAQPGRPGGRSTRRSPADQVERGAGHRGGRVEVRHQQGYGGRRHAGAPDAVDQVGVGGVDEPAVEERRRPVRAP